MKMSTRFEVALLAICMAVLLGFGAVNAQVGSTAPELNTFNNFTDSNAFDEDLTFSRNAVIVAIKFHASAASTTNENLEAYDTGTGFKFINRDMIGDTDYALLPSEPIPVKAGSTITIAYLNTDAADLNVEVVWRFDR